jgi:hypothetical protein
MILNAGTLSLIFGSIFIILAIGGFIIFSIFLNRKTTDPAKADKIIDIWKWTLGTMLVGVCSTVITDVFKQRESDQNMMSSFNQYINIIVDTGSVDKKWQLCMFFVAVSPEGEMRNSWLRYKDTLISGRNRLSSLNKKEAKLALQISQQPEATPTQLNSLKLIQQQRQEVLSSLNAVENGSYLIIVSGNKELKDANTDLSKARAISKNAVLYKKGNMYRTVFNNLNKQQAQDLMTQVQSSLNQGAYIVKQSNWCPSYQTTADCLVCTTSN